MKNNPPLSITIQFKFYISPHPPPTNFKRQHCETVSECVSECGNSGEPSTVCLYVAYTFCTLNVHIKTTHNYAHLFERCTVYIDIVHAGWRRAANRSCLNERSKRTNDDSPTNERTNERTNDRTNDRMNERTMATTKPTNSTDGRTDGRTNARGSR